RYIVGRASLRSVLGVAIGMRPASVPIVSGERGRPRLADGGHAGTGASSPGGAGVPRLDFNISHTAGVAMIGVASGMRIGVDIERRDRAINAAGIARKFLSAAERADLATLSADAARQRILALWTCKEAMSKATGDALSAPFAAMSVGLAGGPRLDDGPAPYVSARWELCSASAPADYFATVALWRRGG
ncbi:MAG: 4'-phosphopantetheinyl transferase family protein, partial [Casimicrobiaceae bacterium]